VGITNPQSGGLTGNSFNIEATASDPGPNASGIREVRFTYRYCPPAGCGSEVGIGADSSGPSYSFLWTFPCRGSHPEDGFRLIARSVDNCGNVSDALSVPLQLIGRSHCFRSDATAPQAGVWLSELQPPGARGQVVVDGAQAVFPSAGPESFTTPLGPGSHRFEATLVAGRGEGRGSGASWRFDLSSLRLVAGSLRLVSGDVAQLAGDAVVFRLRGRAGERVVFSFEVARP